MPAAGGEAVPGGVGEELIYSWCYQGYTLSRTTHSVLSHEVPEVEVSSISHDHEVRTSSFKLEREKKKDLSQAADC